jgi:hypothetical protein
LTESATGRTCNASGASALPVPDLTKLMQFMMRVPKDEAEAQKLRAEIGAFALGAQTVPEETCIGFFASVAETAWPAKYSCTAVDALDGRFEHDTIRRPIAAASGIAQCQALPPITINGRRYVDGGMRSPRTSISPKVTSVIAVAVIPAGAANWRRGSTLNSNICAGAAARESYADAASLETSA